jgi:putative SOS response-associated peptidase YedK
LLSHFEQNSFRLSREMEVHQQIPGRRMLAQKALHLNLRRLGVENRCFVPFTSFSEFNKEHGGDVWFAFDDTRPLAVFAGIWTGWTSVRKVREGETTDELFGFLTTEPNDVIKPVHPKAMD